MIALAVALVLAQAEPILTPCSDQDPCDAHDAPRLIVTIAAQKERAEKAEKIADLERAARIAAEQLAKNEGQRAEDWKQTSREAAYRPWYEQPLLLYGGGVVTGVLLTVTILAVTR